MRGERAQSGFGSIGQSAARQHVAVLVSNDGRSFRRSVCRRERRLESGDVRFEYGDPRIRGIGTGTCSTG
ncbi:hypothetical protein PSP20601_05074 [Pandoraea sputorum]|nr:hypothetical protein PSP20601_05074 [Pandoraea sputorum]